MHTVRHVYSIRYSFQILLKREFSRQILEKYSEIKFHENSCSGSRVFRADGRTDKPIDRHEDVNSRFS
jgi:hypothetical protein